MFNFTPLLGAQTSSPASQSLLEFEGGIKVLVDVGWESDFDISKLKELEKHVPTLSIILLTHATTAHIAAFAHCCKHFPLFTQVPIYATLPVISLGRTLLQDIYSSTPLASSVIPKESFEGTSLALAADGNPQILLSPPTTEEIASYFSLINPLKYSQPHQPIPSPFSPPLNGLTISAYNAGHTLGGTIWHIQHGMESVVYAVDWNLVRENVFSGAAWLGGSGGGGAEVIEQLRKPTALVCSTKGAQKISNTGGRAKRDELLLDMIRSALSKGGTVLIPTDTSARVLELAYLLDHSWRKEVKGPGDNPFKSAKLYLASRNVGATMRYARSMLEWMDESVVREFETEATTSASRSQRRADGKRNNQEDLSTVTGKASEQAAGPFDFKFLRLVERRSRVEKVLSQKGPQVILTSDTSLSWGFSKDALVRLAGDPSNIVILTEDHSMLPEGNAASPGGIAKTLWSWYCERQDGVAVETGSGGQTLEQVYTDGRELRYVDVLRVPLGGKELTLYQQYIATQRQLQNVAQSSGATTLENSADAIDDASSSSSSESDESDSERQGKALNYSTTLGQATKNREGGGRETLGINVLIKEAGVYDYDVRGKKGREAIFPYVTKRRRTDEFGELIRPEDYLRAEERDEIEGHDMREEGIGKHTGLGEKRKWAESDMSNGDGRRQSLGSFKRRRHGNANSKEKSSANIHNGSAYPNDNMSSESESDAEEESSVPSKLVTSESAVKVSLRLAYIDFAGLHDQRNLSMLIPLIQPRKMVLVGGTKSETMWLAEESKEKLRMQSGGSQEGVMDDIFTPVNGQTVSASMDTNAWTVKLSESLVRRLHWQNVRGLGVVTLMGRLAAAIPPEQSQNDAQRRKRQKIIKDEENTQEKPETAVELPPTLDVLPPSMAIVTRTVAQPLHVGDLRLADLRKILQSNGHIAEFRGQGTLLIDGLVTVRKSAGGQVEVEASGMQLLETAKRGQEASFTAVKSRIYEGLAVIAGD